MCVCVCASPVYKSINNRWHGKRAVPAVNINDRYIIRRISTSHATIQQCAIAEQLLYRLSLAGFFLLLNFDHRRNGRLKDASTFIKKRVRQGEKRNYLFIISRLFLFSFPRFFFLSYFLIFFAIYLSCNCQPPDSYDPSSPAERAKDDSASTEGRKY